MSGGNNSIVTKLTARIFPVMPDFYGMMVEQCDVTARGMDVFLEFMKTADTAKADQVRAIEKEGDELKTRQMEVLNRAFATPMDREDIFRAIMAIDEVLNYGKTTVREMEALEIKPDEHMVAMAQLVRDGAYSLKSGYSKLSTNPMDAEVDAAATRKGERNTEKAYRSALADLFSPDKDIETALRAGVPGAQADAFIHIMEVLKRREVYRHLSNAADKLEHAGSVLHDIVVQIA
ncbi:MAG: DUF47 family protein [Gammaproteobacteria bacterium]|jgi:uncharacterized protein Yka (UPF0111/DUF47 family)|nr:DUF47 family protein [Gammaproteobacteria bacterium]